MSDDPGTTALGNYVEAAARLAHMPLEAERVDEVVAVMGRIHAFAADLRAFALADDTEIAGIFTP
jgi:hypothetical protein